MACPNCERPMIPVYLVRPGPGFAWCAFDRREDADAELATIRAEGDTGEMRVQHMDPVAFERLGEFEGY